MSEMKIVNPDSLATPRQHREYLNTIVMLRAALDSVAKERDHYQDFYSRQCASTEHAVNRAERLQEKCKWLEEHPFRNLFNYLSNRRHDKY